MPVALTCKTCGKEYNVSPSRVGRSQYCSYDCAYKGMRKPRLKKKCIVCGKTFEVIAGNKWRKDAKYCSLDCYYANNTGKKHANYKHGYGSSGTPEQRKEWYKRVYAKHKKRFYNESRYKRLKNKYGNILKGYHSHEEWQRLLNEHNYKCYYCGKTLSDNEGKDKATRDHKLPIMRGGSDYISNIVPSCKSCNSSKGNMTATEYMEFLQNVCNE